MLNINPLTTAVVYKWLDPFALRLDEYIPVDKGLNIFVEIYDFPEVAL